MAIGTFAELKTALENWEERTDFSARENEFVALGEAEIKREFAAASLRLREMETRSDMTPASGVCTLPTDFVAMKKVQARTTDARRLEFKPMDWLDEAYPDGSSGDPSFYGILGGSLYMFPLTTSDIRIDYYAYPPALSDAATTNWLLTKYPDVYLFACLKAAKVYEMDEAGIAKCDFWFKQALAGLTSAAFGADITPGTSRTAAATAW